LMDIKLSIASKIVKLDFDQIFSADLAKNFSWQ